MSEALLPPIVIVSPEIVTNLRGRPQWVVYFNIVSFGVSYYYGRLVAISGGGGYDWWRGFHATFAVLFCFRLVAIVHHLLAKNASPGFLSKSMSIQYFFRGAIFSVLIALILEVLEELELPRPNLDSHFWVLPIAITAGFAEEVGKLALGLLGLCLVPHRLPDALATNGMKCTFMLIESPKALAFAGVATGLGFMTSENLEYFYKPFSTMPAFVRWFLLFFRTLLNLHPYLTGLSAARLAGLVWHAEGQRSVTIGRVTWAILPSIVIHALFDFGLMLSRSDHGDPNLQMTMIVVSLLLIPTSIVLFVLTYRRLPDVQERSLNDV